MPAPPGLAVQSRRLRLSAERRAYLLDRDNFLAELRHHARRLSERGYTVAPTDTPYRFRLFREDDDHQKPLLVDPVALSCTCPFHRRQADREPLSPDGSVVSCRHLIGLTDLIECTLATLRAQDDTRRYYPLAAYWAATRDALRRAGRPVILSRLNPEERTRR